MAPAPAATAGALAAQFVDYDNDGMLDLLTWSADGPRLLRASAGEWSDVTARAFVGTASGVSASRSASAALAADVDGDGDMDVIASDASAGHVAVWRNDGGSRNASMRVRLTARVSNRSGLGAKIDLRAGSLRQRLESSSSTPSAAPTDILFGLGRRRGADVVRVLWPSGILQAESAGSRGVRPHQRRAAAAEGRPIRAPGHERARGDDVRRSALAAGGDSPARRGRVPQ